MPPRILKSAVQGVAKGIGLVSEGIHHHKDRKDARDQSELEGNHGERQNRQDWQPDTTLIEDDEEQWDLDEAQAEFMLSHSDHTTSQDDPQNELSRHDKLNPTKVTDSFLQRHPRPHTAPYEKLPLPVILPQRRPKARERGFIRAYAPDLAIKAISQDTFLDFIETFNTATLADPRLDAINLAGMATLALPFGVGTAIQLALAVSIKVAKDVQSRKR
jgi:hypothetical protein